MDNKEQFDASFANVLTAPRVEHPVACPWINTERIERYMDFVEVTTSEIFMWELVYHSIILKRPIGGYAIGEKFRAAIFDVKRDVVTFVREL